MVTVVFCINVEASEVAPVWISATQPRAIHYGGDTRLGKRQIDCQGKFSRKVYLLKENTGYAYDYTHVEEISISII